MYTLWLYRSSLLLFMQISMQRDFKSPSHSTVQTTSAGFDTTTCDEFTDIIYIYICIICIISMYMTCKLVAYHILIMLMLYLSIYVCLCHSNHRYVTFGIWVYCLLSLLSDIFEEHIYIHVHVAQTWLAQNMYIYIYVYT